MKFPIYFSKKIAFSKDNKNNLSQVIIFIGRLSVAIGVMVSLITISTGFGSKEAIKNKIGDFGGHIPLFHFGENVVEVGAAALHGAVEIGAAGAIVGFVTAHDFGIDFAHAEALLHTAPQVIVADRGRGVAQDGGVEVGDGSGNLLRRMGLGKSGGRNPQA